MKQHLYDDGTVVHLCEGKQVHPDVYLVWTKCGKDVPANKSFMSEESITCKKCLEDV